MRVATMTYSTKLLKWRVISVRLWQFKMVHWDTPTQKDWRRLHLKKIGQSHQFSNITTDIENQEGRCQLLRLFLRFFFQILYNTFDVETVISSHTTHPMYAAYHTCQSYIIQSFLYKDLLGHKLHKSWWAWHNLDLCGTWYVNVNNT